MLVRLQQRQEFRMQKELFSSCFYLLQHPDRGELL